MAVDELSGERLSREQEGMASVQKAGGKVFVAVGSHDFVDRVEDVLDRPVFLSHVHTRIDPAAEKYPDDETLSHLPEIAQAGRFTHLQHSQRFPKANDEAHRFGYKIFTHMNPVSGMPPPELQRRNEDLGL